MKKFIRYYLITKQSNWHLITILIDIFVRLVLIHYFISVFYIQDYS